MKISLIVAMDENRLIGAAGDLPWRLPADLRHFKRNTVGKAILMGRKTFDSIGRPLPDRLNIVISRDPRFDQEGCETVTGVEQALERAQQAGLDELVVIGGAEIYSLCLTTVDNVYITRVHEVFDGDTWFPELDMTEWEQLAQEKHQPDEKNPHAYSFITLQRKNKTADNP